MENLMDKYLVERRDSRKIEGDDLDWGLTSDGWDYKQMCADTDMLVFIDNLEKVTYELKNARRNSYARFGDTIKDLADEFKNISNDAKNIAKDLKTKA